jgi:hypothetical protein
MPDGRTSKLVQIFGEHCVIAELSRRGLIAAAFSQQIPAYDIVASDERGKSVLIQVKGSRSGSWQLAPITKWLEIKLEGDLQIPGKAMPEPVNRLIVVFVQMGQNSGPDKFYILRWKVLQDILIQEYTGMLKRHNARRPNNPQSLHAAISWRSLEPWENKWDLITNNLK